jgi:uncharacterized protein (DUF305 family)
MFMQTTSGSLMFGKSTPSSTMIDAESRATENVTAGMGGMMQNNPMAVTSEKEFIEQMIPHHEEAITTAREVLLRGATNQGMVDLLNNIITTQTAEVKLMEESYSEWFGKEYEMYGEYTPMMRNLSPYEKEQLDKVFLHDMTMHHMGAIMMARSLQPHLEHETMRELTRNIVVNQSEEIKIMQQLFGDL